MKKTFISLLTLLAFVGNSFAQKVKPAIPSDPVIEEKIEQWINKMTLDEKIGQMCEITVDVITDWKI